MSGNGFVVFIGLVAFAGGVVVALRLFPVPEGGRVAELVLWVSRLVAGAALGAFALDVYAAAKRQSGADAPTDPVDLADGLARALFDVGVLFALAVGLAVVGALMLARDHARPDVE